MTGLFHGVKEREAWHAAVHGVVKRYDLATEKQQRWPQGSSMLSRVSEFLFFLRLNNISLYGFATFCLFIHLPVDTWVVLTFWLLQTMLWMWVYKYLFMPLTFSSLGYIPKSRLAGSHDNFIFSCLRNCHAVFHSSCTNLYPHQQCTGLLPSQHPYQHLLFPVVVAYSNHSDWYEVKERS